jgi:hypothetical protein
MREKTSNRGNIKDKKNAFGCNGLERQFSFTI